MNREEEIKQVASEYTGKYDFSDCEFDDAKIGFISGAQWADNHPSSSLIVKVWNLATKTAIAQVNKEIPYFNSEKEIEEFINKKLKL